MIQQITTLLQDGFTKEQGSRGNRSTTEASRNDTEKTLTDQTQIGRLKHLFLWCCRQVCPDFEVTDENKPLLNDLLIYAVGMPGKLDPKKGLWLQGGFGSGKSTLLRALRLFDSQIKGTKNGFFLGGFRITNATQVVLDCMKEKDQGGSIAVLDKYTDDTTQAFDELGSEPVNAKIFGTPIGIFEHILQMRYDRMKYSRTHVTTNMMLSDVSERYGKRIYDRCIEMFNEVDVCTQYSRRK